MLSIPNSREIKYPVPVKKGWTFTDLLYSSPAGLQVSLSHFPPPSDSDIMPGRMVCVLKYVMKGNTFQGRKYQSREIMTSL